jgi:nitrate/nitrite transport system ATP-binding protein
VNHDPAFRDVRRQIIEYLLGPGARKSVSLTRTLHLPDIEPEDLDVHRPVVGGRRRAIRKSEIKRETVEISG